MDLPILAIKPPPSWSDVACRGVGLAPLFLCRGAALSRVNGSDRPPGQIRR
jgi:hypothetical protein